MLLPAPPLHNVRQGENGIAVKLGTEGNKALTSATEEVLGGVKPYSITGSLPLVRYLQVSKEMMMEDRARGGLLS